MICDAGAMVGGFGTAARAGVIYRNESLHAMKDEVQERLGANEAVFREINEGIERGQWPGEEDAPISFRCECARLGCNELIDLTPRAYEDVRANPRRFIVLAGHERPDVETVVERHPGYFVVEKRDQAGVEAARSDPRST